MHQRRRPYNAYLAEVLEGAVADAVVLGMLVRATHLVRGRVRGRVGVGVGVRVRAGLG